MIRLAILGAALSSLALLACNGCNGGGNAPPPPTPGASASTGAPVSAPGETVVHVEDDGHTFDVTRGNPVTFKLARDAATGFVWTPIGIDPSVLAQQGDRASETSSDVPGAPKMDVFHFMANAPGTAAVEMDLKRPFGSAPPGRVIHVTINVH
jgi:predicted secreted protein